MNTDNEQSVFIPNPAKPESVFIRVPLRSIHRTGIFREAVHPIALEGNGRPIAGAVEIGISCESVIRSGRITLQLPLPRRPSAERARRG